MEGRTPWLPAPPHPHVRQELSTKDQEKVAEVSRVRVELQEQSGRLQAERAAQEALREKVAALERRLKGELSWAGPVLLGDPPGGQAAALGSVRIAEPPTPPWRLCPPPDGLESRAGPEPGTAPTRVSCPAVIASDHREALLDRESENASLREKLRLKEAEIARIREEEVQRANFLQNAVLAYVQGSPLRAMSPQK